VQPAAILNLAVIANTAPTNVALAGTQARLRATAMTSTRAGNVMKKAFVGIGLAAGAAGVALFKIGEEFDDAYDKIRTRTGATGKEMVKLKRSFRDVVSDVPATFEDASTAVGDLNTRLGLSGRPLRQMSKQMTELSRITETDVSSNVEAVAKAFVDWEVKTKDQSKTLDGFFRLSQRSGMAVADIAESVQKFGSPLRQLGFSLDEAAAMFASFERAGVNTQTMVPGLKLAISNLTRPTDVLAESMDKLGIKAGKPDKALRQVFELMTSKGLPTVEKTGLAMDVFGKRAGADMAEAIKQGRFELTDFLKVMRDGDQTIRGTGRQTMDLAEHWQRFTNLLKVQLEPIAKKVFKGLSDLMKEVSQAFKERGLEGVLNLFIDKLNAALPKIAEFGGKIAGALFRGIINAPIWAKFLAAGWLVSKLGGLGGLSGIGTKLGTRFGMSLGGAAGPIAAGMIGSVLAGIEVGKKLDIGQTDIGEHFAEQFDLARNKAERLVEFMRAHPGMEAEDALREMNRVARERLGAVRREIEHLQNTWGLSLREIKQQTDRNMKQIEQSLGTHSKRGRQAISDNFMAAIEAIKNSMKSGEIAAGKGAREIHQILLRQLKSYGIKDAEGFLKRAESVRGSGGEGHRGLQRGGAITVSGTGLGDKVPAMLEPGEVVWNREAVKRMGGAQKANAVNQAFPRFQGGGIVSAPGFPGERINSAVIPAFNSLVKRFNLFLYDAFGPGHKSTEHTQYGTAIDVGPAPGGSWADVTRAVAYSVKAGFNPVYYDGSGGSISLPPHGPGHHAHITLLTAAELLSGQTAGAFGGAGMARLKLPRFTSDFGLGLTVAQGLNNTAAAVEKVIGKRAAMVGGAEGAEAITGGGSTAENRALGRRMMLMKPGRYKKDAQTMFWGPWGPSEWPAYDRLIESESGWSTTATNPTSGAYGIPQSLPGSKMATAGSDWRTNAATQIAWGLDYIRDPEQGGYGSPSNVPLGGYRLGGVIQKLQEGGIVDVDKIVKQLRGAAGPGERREIIGQARDRINKRTAIDVLDAEGGLSGILKDLDEKAALFAENASFASSLGLTDDNGNVIPGSDAFQGVGQAGWIGEQLKALFELRNRLIVSEGNVGDKLRAIGALMKKIKGPKGLLAAINERIKEIKKRLRELEDARKKLENDLETATTNKEKSQKAIQERLDKELAKPKKKQDPEYIERLRSQLRAKSTEKEAIRELLAQNRDQTRQQNEALARQTMLRDAFKSGGPISTALTGRQDALTAGRDTMLERLRTVQGGGVSMELLGELPGLGILKGEIGDAQLTLRELGAKQPEITDQLADLRVPLLEEKLAAAQATAFMLAQQMPTFQRLFGEIPQFAGGGVAQGPVGAPVPAVVHGGEGVFTPEQMAALGGPSEIRVFIGDTELRGLVRTEIRDENGRLIRVADRTKIVPGRNTGR
jgi:TP901 family phage tail tape measure protein